jgi:hypothetical protein
VIALVTKVEGERKRKGQGVDGTASLFRWNEEVRKVNSGVAGLGRKNGDGTRLETSWDGGPEVGQKASWAEMKLGRGGRKGKEKHSWLRTRPN